MIQIRHKNELRINAQKKVNSIWYSKIGNKNEIENEMQIKSHNFDSTYYSD